jgi:hypothetical protein
METMQRKWNYLMVLFLVMAGVLFAAPIPSQLKQGDIIPELVWSDRSIKKNVKIINLIAGRVILKHDSGTDQLRLADFQKLVQLTNASLEDVRKEGEEKIKSLQEAREAQLKLQSQKPVAAVPSPFGAVGTPAIITHFSHTLDTHTDGKAISCSFQFPIRNRRSCTCGYSGNFSRGHTCSIGACGFPTPCFSDSTTSSIST